jgi:hypothetical protein
VLHRFCCYCSCSRIPAVAAVVAAAAGKSFFKKKKQPIPVDLKSSDFPGTEQHSTRRLLQQLLMCALLCACAAGMHACV